MSKRIDLRQTVRWIKDAKKDYSNFTISGESSDTRSSHFESIEKRLVRIACKITMVKFGERERVTYLILN